MQVKTPEYWQEAEFQPLVEVQTAYGNKVKIPQSLLNMWNKWEQRKGKFPLNVERAKAAGLFQKTIHNRVNQDILRVYYEQYQE